MLRFFSCFGCQEKGNATVNQMVKQISPSKHEPVVDKQANQQQKQYRGRKLSSESFTQSDAIMTSTTATQSKNDLQDEQFVLGFVERIKSETLEQRKKLQFDFVKKNCFCRGPKYAIQKPWSVQYTDFLNKDKSSLRKIDNSCILKSGRIKSGLESSKDYFVVSKKVWILIKSLYGGGPEIQKNKMLPITNLPFFGLQNNLYSCYMNSGMQAMFSIPEFVDYFYYGYFKNQKIRTKHPQKRLSCMIQDSIQKIQTSSIKNSSFSFDKMKHFFQQKFPSSYQHDCQQFIRFFISRLQQQLNPKIKISDKKATQQQIIDNYQQTHTSIVDSLFGGQLNSHIKCSRCENISIAYDPIMQLTLEMTSISLQQCIKEYFSPQKLVDLYQCQRCLKKSKATRQFYIAKSPLYLMITLKRFQGNHTKNTDNIQYPKQLNLSNYFKTPTISNYTLQSTIIHKGQINKGHYYIQTQRQEKWYQISDDRIRKIQIDDNLESEAYILIYRQ